MQFDRIVVDAEFAALCPPLSGEEYANLEGSIIAEGCRDALVVWDGVLLDGHNRLRICQEYDIEYNVQSVDLPDRDAAIRWIILNQLGRRNLHPDAASLLRGRLYNMRKKDVGRPKQLDQNDPITPMPTADRLATETGVSAPTIKRDGAFAQAVEDLAPYVPDIGDRAMAGDIPSRKAVIDAAKEPEDAPRKLAHVAQNTGNNEWYTPPEYIEAARAVMGGIDCDPASSEIANRTVKATTFYTIDDDGLRQRWHGRVWMNPPYSQPHIANFADALIEHLDDAVTEAIVLVNNATETGWFQSLLSRASAACFLRGRIKYLTPQGIPANAPLQGQVILYYGKDTAPFGKVFANLGRVLYASL